MASSESLRGERRRESAGMVDDRDRSRVLEHAPVAPAAARGSACRPCAGAGCQPRSWRSEGHTSALQSHVNLVCRLLLETKKNTLASATPNTNDKTYTTDNRNQDKK